MARGAPGLALGLWLATTGALDAAGVVMLSGKTESEAQMEIALRFPDGSYIDREAVARAARALGARDEDTIVWFASANRAQRLDELPPDQRVAFHCLAQGIEAFERGAVLLTPASSAIDPALWVHGAEHRALWWPNAPDASTCGAAIAVLELVPAVLSFGSVALSEQRELDALLRNLGTVELTLGQAVANGAGYALVADACSGARLFPGQSCDIRIAFLPLASGEASGHVALPNSGITPLALLALSGSGLAPAQLTVQPVSLAFGDVVLGSSSQRGLTVSNSGEASLTLGDLEIGGTDFSLAADGCSGMTLSGGASCTAQIGFAPTLAGTRSGSLAVVRADGEDAAVPLSGTGTELPPDGDRVFASGFEF